MLRLTGEAPVPGKRIRSARTGPVHSKNTAAVHSGARNASCHVPASHFLRTTLLVVTGTTAAALAIAGAGALADMIPAAVVAMCMVVLLGVFLVGLAACP